METNSIYQFWRLSEDTPDNLGLACAENGLLLGQTPLIERRGGRFVVRDRQEIARLLQRAYPGGLPVDRLMPGLTTVACALNANDLCLACIAAVHLKIPDLANFAARDALSSEDLLIKYERGDSGDDWNPALHPRAGVPPNPGWFAPTDGSQHQSDQDRSTSTEPGVRIATDDSRRTDASSTGDASIKLPGNPIDEPANFAGRFGASEPPGGSELWSKVWPAFRNWLQQPVPEYDLDTGEVVGERPRWRAIAPYVGVTAATLAVLGVEAYVPAVAEWLGAGGRAAADVAASADAEGPRLIGQFPVPENMKFGTTNFGNYAHDEIVKLLQRTYSEVKFIFRAGRGQAGVDVEVQPDWIDAVGFRYAEIKPLSTSGERRFIRQVLDWDLPAPVKPIAYDRVGKFYWGFR